MTETNQTEQIPYARLRVNISETTCNQLHKLQKLLGKNYTDIIGLAINMHALFSDEEDAGRVMLTVCRDGRCAHEIILRKP